LDGIKEAGQSAAAPLVTAMRQAARDRAASDQQLLDLEVQKFQYQKEQRDAEEKKATVAMRMQATKHLIEVATAAAISGDKVPLRLAWALYVQQFPELRAMAPEIFGAGATGPP
jgi:hypothetical protein